ncbi:MAG: hypothetical protein AB7M05_20820 [Alphaproteobacteria bacterium]
MKNDLFALLPHWGSPDIWSAIADWVIAIANVTLFAIGFRALRHDRDRIAKVEARERQRFSEEVFVWIEETADDYVTVVCRNGGRCAIYNVRVGIVSISGEALGQRYRIETMKPHEELSVRVDSRHNNAEIGAVVDFRDPAGLAWRRHHNGVLVEVDCS